MSDPELPPVYPAPPGNATPYPYQRTAPTNTLAIITIIAAFVIPIAGIITGHIALSQIRRTGEQGNGLAKAGLILSYIFVGIGLVVIVIWIIVVVALIGVTPSVYGY